MDWRPAINGGSSMPKQLRILKRSETNRRIQLLGFTMKSWQVIGPLCRNNHTTPIQLDTDHNNLGPGRGSIRVKRICGSKWRLNIVLILVMLVSYWQLSLSQLTQTTMNDYQTGSNEKRPAIMSIGLKQFKISPDLSSGFNLHMKAPYENTLFESKQNFDDKNKNKKSINNNQGIVPYKPSYLQMNTNTLESKIVPVKALDHQLRPSDENDIMETAASKKKKMMKKKKKMEKKHKEWKKGKKHKKKKYESKKKKGGMEKKKKGKKEKKKWGMEKKGHKKKGNFKKKKWGHKKKMKKGHKKGKKGHKMLKDKGHKKKGFKKVYHKEEWGKKKKWHDIKREKKWNTKQKKWKKKWHQEKGKKYKGKHMKKYHKKNKHGKKYKKEKKSKWKKHKGEKYKKGHKKKKEEYAKKKEGGKKKKMKKMKKEMKKKKKG